MKKRIVFLFVFAAVLTSYAQKTKNLTNVNSRDIILKGIEYADAGKYGEALAEYAKVPFADPLYDYVLYEQGYAQYISGDYRGAILTMQKLLDNPVQIVSLNQIYEVLGNSYDEIGEYEKAIATYDLALKKHPYNYLLYFNKGLSLLRTENYEEALNCFKKAIFLKPNHAGSHYGYGMCYLKMGYTIPGILALNYSTVLNPHSNYVIMALQELNKIYDSGVSAYNLENDVIISDTYEDLNRLYQPIMNDINMRTADSKNFHALSKINHDVVKNNQLVFEKVIERPQSHAIEDMLYVPFAKQMLQNKNFNIMSYYQLQETNVDDGKVTIKASKMQKDFNSLLTTISLQLENIALKGLGIEYPGDTSYIYSTNFILQAWGVRNLKAPDNMRQEDGRWTLLNSKGQIKTINDFANGKQIFTTIFEDNEVSETCQIKDDKYNGKCDIYTHAPLTNEQFTLLSTTLKQNNVDGLVLKYNYAGVLIDKMYVTNNERQGEEISYDNQGNLSGIFHYDAGDYAGLQQTYYPTGELHTKYTVGARNEKSAYVSYYQSGAKEKEGFLMNGNRVGKWITYFPDGSVSSIENFDNEGGSDGEFFTYHRNGKLDSKVIFKKTKPIMITYYNVMGHPVETWEFNNEKITKITVLNADSSVRKAYSIGTKPVLVEIYSEYGYKLRETPMTSSGITNGVEKRFYPNGQLRYEIEYKDGEYHGSTKEYYPNGRMKTYCEYKNGKANGVFVRYYNNAANSVNEEYYMENDSTKGISYTYYPNENLKSIHRYNNEKKLVASYDYSPEGQRMGEIYYNEDLIVLKRQYDKTGQIVSVDTFSNGNGIIHYRSYDGRLQRECPVVAGELHGTIRTYDFNGNLIDTTRYVGGITKDTFRTYNMLGKKSAEQKVQGGKGYGIQYYYDINGNKSAEVYLENDLIEGKARYYQEDILLMECSYLNGHRDGIASYYAPDGKTLLYETLWENDGLVSISYAKANGTMSEPVLIGKDELEVKAYYPNGKVGAVIHFNNGLYNGAVTIYYPNGQSFTTRNYTDDLLNGTYIFYYPNGQIYQSIDYVYDELHGKKLFYYDNGQINTEEDYFYSSQHGKFIHYDKNGNVLHKFSIRCDTREGELE